MEGISSFFGKDRPESSRVERFSKEVIGKTGKQKRTLESALLVPDKIPPYTGTQPPEGAKHPMSSRTVKFVFHRAEDMELFKKHFRVSNFVEQSVADPSFLLQFLIALDTGRIVYNKEKGSFHGK